MKKSPKNANQPLPGLDLLELLKLGHGHEDDDGLLASTAVNLLGCSNVQFSQLSLQLIKLKNLKTSKMGISDLKIAVDL